MVRDDVMWGVSGGYVYDKIHNQHDCQFTNHPVKYCYGYGDISQKQLSFINFTKSSVGCCLACSLDFSEFIFSDFIKIPISMIKTQSTRLAIHKPKY